MSQVNVKPFNAVVGTTPQLALSSNNDRKFLEIQNKGTVNITYKFDRTFTPSQSAIQTIKFDRVPTGGAWKLTKVDQQTGSLAFNANAAAVQSALEGLSNIGGGNVLVTGNYLNGFVVAFQGTLAEEAQPVLTVTANTLTDNMVQQNAVQNIVFSAPPTGGTFRIGDGSSETADLNFDSSATDLKTALNALTSVAGGINTLTQDPTSKDFTVTFDNSPWSYLPAPTLGITDNQLTDDSSEATEIDKMYGIPEPLQGTFALMYGSQITTEIPFDCPTSDIQTALETLPGIGVGNILVFGGWTREGWTFTFRADLADKAVHPITYLATGTPLHPDILQEPQKRIPNDVEVTVVRNTVGHGIDAVAVSGVEILPGIAPAPVVLSVVETQAGFPQPAEGITLTPGHMKSYESAVPLGSVWLVAASGDSNPVTIFEG
jgi:hypothetical protein